MAEARRTDFTQKASATQPRSAREPRIGGARGAHRPQETSRLLTLSEAAALAGVDYKIIYRLHELGLIEALQRDGKGRVYYSESQIRSALKSFFGELGAAA